MTQKNILFGGLFLGLVVVFFLGVELILHLAGVGFETAPFRTATSSGLMSQNPQIMNKYFPADPESLNANRPFDVKSLFGPKKKGTLRGVLLGGSTSQGFPYMVNWDFGFLLAGALESTGKWPKVEMINLAYSAQSSYTTADLVGKLGEAEPDFLLILDGHNEYYGTYSASTSGNYWQKKLSLALREGRIFQVLDHLLLPKNEGGENLMATQFRNRSFPPQAETDYNITQDFLKNQKTVLEWAKSSHLPVLYLEPLSNLLDQPPFLSGTGTGVNVLISRLHQALEERDQVKFQSLTEEGALEPGILEDPAFVYLSAKAELLFKGTMDLDKFRHAKDLDQGPFRARTILVQGLKDWVEKEAQTYPSVAYAPLESLLLQGKSPLYPGFQIFLDHVHFNWQGHREVARAAFPLLARLLGLDNAAIESTLAYFDDLQAINKAIPFTPLFSETAYKKVQDLFALPPFNSMTVPVESRLVNTYPPGFERDLNIQGLLSALGPEKSGIIYTVGETLKAYMAIPNYHFAYNLLVSYHHAHPAFPGVYVNLADFWAATPFPERGIPYLAAAKMLDPQKVSLDRYIDEWVRKNLQGDYRKYSQVYEILNKETSAWPEVPLWGDLQLKGASD